MSADEAASGVRRVQVSTADADAACALVEGTFAGAALRIGGPREADWSAYLDVADAGAFATTRIRLPARVDYDVGYEGQVFVTTVLDGSAHVERGRVATTYRTGDVLVGGCADADWRVRTDQVALSVVTLPEATLSRSLGTDEPYHWRPLAFEPTPGGSTRWRQVSRFVEETLADPDAAASELVLASIARLLAATAVTVFPTAAVDPVDPAGPEPRRDAHPETLRRAIAFIEANPDLDIGLADIARAARVTPRAVQLAFRRHTGVTPLAHLRRVRLDRAHADLLAADAATGTTVTAIAARWGFASSSRFAEQYRAAYAETPSATLRR